MGQWWSRYLRLCVIIKPQCVSIYILPSGSTLGDPLPPMYILPDGRWSDQHGGGQDTRWTTYASKSFGPGVISALWCLIVAWSVFFSILRIIIHTYPCKIQFVLFCFFRRGWGGGISGIAHRWVFLWWILSEPKPPGDLDQYIATDALAPCVIWSSAV